MSILEHDLDELCSFDNDAIVPGSLVSFVASSRRTNDVNDTIGTVLSLVTYVDVEFGDEPMLVATVLWSVPPPWWASNRRINDVRTRKQIVDTLRVTCENFLSPGYSSSKLQHSSRELEKKITAAAENVMMAFQHKGLIVEHYVSCGSKPQTMDFQVVASYKMYSFQSSLTQLTITFRL